MAPRRPRPAPNALPNSAEAANTSRYAWPSDSSVIEVAASLGTARAHATRDRACSNRPPSKPGALSQSPTSRPAGTERATTASALAAARASLCLCHQQEAPAPASARRSLRARSERPTRRLCRSDKTRAPDERDPFRRASGGGVDRRSDRQRRSALALPSVAKEWRTARRRRLLLFAHCDHADGRARTIAPGTEGRPMPSRSSSATVAAGTTDPACASPGRSSRPPAAARQLGPRHCASSASPDCVVACSPKRWLASRPSDEESGHQLRCSRGACITL